MRKTATILLLATAAAPGATQPHPMSTDSRVAAQQADYVEAHFRDSPGHQSNDANDLDSLTALVAGWAAAFPPTRGDSVRHEACGILANNVVSDGGTRAFAIGAALEAVLLQPPTRDDALYAMALQSMLDAGTPDSVRCRYMLEMTMKNIPGSEASDFVFTVADGSSSRLSDLRGRMVMLFFYDPECDACHALASDLGADPLISRRIADGKLAVVALAPDAENNADSPWLPTAWINARDGGRIASAELYATGSYPCLYLIDSNGKVILKEPRPHEITEYLSRD